MTKRFGDNIEGKQSSYKKERKKEKSSDMECEPRAQISIVSPTTNQKS